MDFRKKILIILLVCWALSNNILHAQNLERQWTEAKAINGSFKAVTSQPDIEIFSAPNIVMLRVNENVEVRIFTILGKLVSAQHLEPGIFQYHLESHGIYIIKTEKTSCKIAV